MSMQRTVVPGYLDNRRCGKKMVATFRLCSEQLSAQVGDLEGGLLKLLPW